MLKYIFDIFCKDITIGLCQLDDDKAKVNISYFKSIANRKNIISSFNDSVSIGQTVYHF